MKLTIQTILDAEPAVRHLSGQKLPIKASYNVAKSARALVEETKDFYEAQRKLLDDLKIEGKTLVDEKGKINAAHPNFATFADQRKELIEHEVDVKMHTVSMAMLDGVGLEPWVIASAWFLFEDGDDA